MSRNSDIPSPNTQLRDVLRRAATDLQPPILARRSRSRTGSDGRPANCRNCQHGGAQCALHGHYTAPRAVCKDWATR